MTLTSRLLMSVTAAAPFIGLQLNYPDGGLTETPERRMLILLCIVYSAMVVHVFRGPKHTEAIVSRAERFFMGVAAVAPFLGLYFNYPDGRIADSPERRLILMLCVMYSGLIVQLIRARAPKSPTDRTRQPLI